MNYLLNYLFSQFGLIMLRTLQAPPSSFPDHIRHIFPVITGNEVTRVVAGSVITYVHDLFWIKPVIDSEYFPMDSDRLSFPLCLPITAVVEVFSLAYSCFPAYVHHA